MCDSLGLSVFKSNLSASTEADVWDADSEYLEYLAKEVCGYPSGMAGSSTNFIPGRSSSGEGSSGLRFRQ